MRSLTRLRQGSNAQACRSGELSWGLVGYEVNIRRLCSGSLVQPNIRRRPSAFGKVSNLEFCEAMVPKDFAFGVQGEIAIEMLSWVKVSRPLAKAPIRGRSTTRRWAGSHANLRRARRAQLGPPRRGMPAQHIRPAGACMHQPSDV